MEDNYNSDPNLSKEPKTSSTDSKSNSKTTGDSQVQDGTGVEIEDKKSYEKSDEQQEYIEQANNNTEQANDDVVKDGKTMSMLAATASEDEDDENDDDGDEPYAEPAIGDDPDELGNKIPVM